MSDLDDWLAPTQYRLGPITAWRSNNGYGWGVNIARRVALHSPRATTRMCPSIHRGADEDCNPAVTLVLWPLGHVDVFYRLRQRPPGSGMCNDCLAEFAEEV